MPTTIETFAANLNQDGKALKVTYSNGALTIEPLDQMQAFGFIGTLFGVLGQMGGVEQVQAPRVDIHQTMHEVTPPLVLIPRPVDDGVKPVPQLQYPHKHSPGDIICRNQKEHDALLWGNPALSPAEPIDPQVAAKSAPMTAAPPIHLPPLSPPSDEPRPGARLPDPQPESVKRKKREAAKVVEAPVVVQQPALSVVPPPVEDKMGFAPPPAPMQAATVPPADVLPGVDAPVAAPDVEAGEFDVATAAKELDGVTYMSKIIQYLMAHGVASRAGMVECCKQLRPHHRGLGKLVDDAVLVERVNRACVGIVGVVE